MARYPRRYLIVPDAEVDAAALVVAQSPLDDAPQQAGLSVRQPTLDAEDPVEGDLRPTLSGTPEAAAEGPLLVTKSGVVEAARFAWMRGEDDQTTSMQLRQSPHVVGRRTDILARFASPSTTHLARPKLLSLKGGGLLLVYAEVSVTPVFARDAVTQNGVLRVALLYPEDNTWSTPAPGPTPQSFGSTAVQTRFLGGFDVVQMPDTGEILLFIAMSNSSGSTPPTLRRLFTYVSEDDGTTWTERSRRHFSGVVPELVLDVDGDGKPDDDAAPVALAAEVLDSGRISALLLTEDNTWALTSDDRGNTWTARRVAAHGADNQQAGHGVSSTRFRNGLIGYVVALRDVVSDPNVVSLYLTGNGIDFTPDIALTSNLLTVDAAICVAPDGWPHVYGTVHRATNPDPLAQTFRDWLWGRRLTTRDPFLGAVTADLLPIPPDTGSLGRTSFAFHCTEGTPSGTYVLGVGTDPGPAYQGFTSLDVVEHRGQVVMAVVVQRDTTGGTSEAQPALQETALVVYRLNHWQPIQERLGNAHPDVDDWLPGYPAAGRIYNRTWDCYGLPSNWGWTSAGAGAASIVVGDSDLGCMEISQPDRTFADASLPAPSASRDIVVRMLVKVVSGGSLSADDIALRGFASNGVTAASAFIVRLARSGAVTTVALVNYASGLAIGTAAFPADRWLEILVVAQESGSGFVLEAYGRAPVDPDWDEPYTLIGSTTSTLGAVAVADGVVFGHFDTAPCVSRWKSVHIHRTEDRGVCALWQYGIGGSARELVDEDRTQDYAVDGAGETRLDSGITNVMRSSLTTTSPRQWLTRGTSVLWRGEATGLGGFDRPSGYDYGAANVLIEPVLREWRSLETGKGVELIFDAGTRSVRPTALAVFGRNFPGLTVQLGDDDGAGGYDWGAAYVLGYPGSGLGGQRHTHLWSLLAGGEWTYLVRERRVTVFPPEGAGPWRPHQFRSVSGGPQFYWTIRNLVTGDRFVFRIEDNTADTLLLGTAPIAGDLVIVGENGPVWAASWSIFSDRFAVLIDHRLPATFTAGAGVYSNSHVRGWRFLRLYMPDVTHVDADAAFYRLGRVILGQAIDLSAPDYQWGWSRSQSSGVELSETTGGARYSARRRPGRRTLSLDYAHMLPPPEADAVLYSPAEQPSMRSWAAWLDVVRRLELDATPAALVFDGERAYAETGEDLVQVASDPEDLRLVRCTSAGTVEHTGWVGRDMNLADGVKCVPRPVCTIRGITFEEEL